MRKLLSSLFILMLLVCNLMAQERTITGTVKGKDDGLPLPGVSVRVKGTNTGTQTGANGQFSLRVPGNSSVLVFTYIGYSVEEVTVGNRNVLAITLSSNARQLSEVVVTSLGINRQKKEIGYAASTVQNDVITQANPVNVSNGLQGKVSGLNVTTTNTGVFENVKINLRGIRSLLGNNNPLLLLDGVPLDINYLSSINPNDIENVTVLKGASGAAVYGPDARNGVIVVTTKKGSKGDKPVITFGSSAQAQSISFFPKLQESFGSGGGGVYTSIENWSWGPQFDGSMVQIGDVLPDGTAQMVPYSPTNDRKEFFDTGLTFQNDLSYAAKDFFLSLQDANIKGIVPDDKNRRTGIRMNTSKEYGKFKANFNTNYIQQNYDVFDDIGMADWNTANNVGLNQGLMNLIFNTPAQIPLTSYKDFVNNPYAQFNNYFNNYGLNPYFALDNWRKKGKREDIITNLDLNIKATDWLNVVWRGGLASQSITERRTSKGENPSPFGLDRGFNIIPGTVEERSMKYTRLSSELFANVNKEINDDFKVTGNIGTYVRQDEGRDTRVGATSLVVPELFNVDNLVGQLTGSSPYRRSRLFSVYATAGLSYRGWANVEVTGRNDKTSVLTTGKNSFFYPGVSGSLVLSDAIETLKSSSFLSYLKLRGAWSKTGNADLAPYSLQATFGQTSGFPYGTLPGFTANNTAYDVNLEPEFIQSKELGIESSFSKGRINFEATYFHQNNDNQIIPISISSATGYTKNNVNAASFINKGVEMDLKLTPIIRTADFRFDFNANATYLESEITSVYEGLDEVFVGGYANAANYIVKGKPAFVLKATDYVRDPQGRVVVDAETGLPTQDPIPKVYGQTMPKWIVGLNPTFSWKGINVSALFEYKGGYYAYHDIGNAMAWTGVSAATATNNRERYVFPNSSIKNADGSYSPNTNVTINNFESFYIGTYRTVTSNFITSANSWRFRELSIGYTVPTKLLGKQSVIKGLSIALTGRNLALWVPKTNVYSDPDFTFSPANSNFGTGNTTGVSTSNTSGIGNSTINPPVRIWGGNINLTF